MGGPTPTEPPGQKTLPGPTGCQAPSPADEGSPSPADEGSPPLGGWPKAHGQPSTVPRASPLGAMGTMGQGQGNQGHGNHGPLLGGENSILPLPERLESSGWQSLKVEVSQESPNTR